MELDDSWGWRTAGRLAREPAARGASSGAALPSRPVSARGGLSSTSRQIYPTGLKWSFFRSIQATGWMKPTVYASPGPPNAANEPRAFTIAGRVGSIRLLARDAQLPVDAQSWQRLLAWVKTASGDSA